MLYIFRAINHRISCTVDVGKMGRHTVGGRGADIDRGRHYHHRLEGIDW